MKWGKSSFMVIIIKTVIQSLCWRYFLSPHNQNKLTVSKHRGHNALVLSFIRFRRSAPFFTPFHPSTSITPLQYAIQRVLSFQPPTTHLPLNSTSLLASNVAGKLIWQPHLRPKDGGGLQRGHFWLCRGGRVRVCLSQLALIIFRLIWWPLPLLLCRCECVCIYIHTCVCHLNDS